MTIATWLRKAMPSDLATDGPARSAVAHRFGPALDLLHRAFEPQCVAAKQLARQGANEYALFSKVTADQHTHSLTHTHTTSHKHPHTWGATAVESVEVASENRARA